LVIYIHLITLDLWEFDELKELVPKFKKKYFMVKQFRVLREERILKKNLGYTMQDMGHATLCIKVGML
jgi:hypothetical protein